MGHDVVQIRLERAVIFVLEVPAHHPEDGWEICMGEETGQYNRVLPPRGERRQAPSS